MIIIAIDGPAGAGKGTISQYLAMKFDLLYLDTGMLYRALAKAVIAQKVDPSNHQAVTHIARTITVNDIHAPDLRGEAVAAVASQVAVIGKVRDILNDLQRNFCGSVKAPYQGAVLDGRDIGTIICPEATCKLFITAHPEIRNRRRLLENQMEKQGNDEDASQITQKIIERDTRDRTRKIAPLTPAADAFIMDTSDLTIDQACAKAALYVAERCLKLGSSDAKQE